MSNFLCSFIDIVKFSELERQEFGGFEETLT